MTLPGAALQLPGVLVDYAKVSQSVSTAATPFTTEQRQWDSAAAPLVLNTRALVRAMPVNVDYVLGRRRPPLIVQPSGEADRSFSQQFSFSLDLWWLYLFYLGAIPSWALAAIVGGFAAVLAALGSRLDAEINEPGGFAPLDDGSGRLEQRREAGTEPPELK
jgi:hypothetical protein